jgi:hypothetical protein
MPFVLFPVYTSSAGHSSFNSVLGTVFRFYLVRTYNTRPSTVDIPLLAELLPDT